MILQYNFREFDLRWSDYLKYSGSSKALVPRKMDRTAYSVPGKWLFHALIQSGRVYNHMFDRSSVIGVCNMYQAVGCLNNGRICITIG